MIIKSYAKRVLGAAAIFAGAQAAGHAANLPEQSRGEMLYSTHCIGCHTTHVHWRDQRLATDWESLARQVRRWQGNASLGWDEEDIAEVTRYLNRRYYHFPSGEEKYTSSLREMQRR